MANIPKGYVMRAYREAEWGEPKYRINPDYPREHQFTVIKCDKCGEWFEVDREHICGKQNSYPEGTWWDDVADNDEE